MRRRPGLHGIAAAAKINEQYRVLGEETQAKKLEKMREQMATFKYSLEHFAADHREDIRKDPNFRRQFHAMCANIGVDPLVSNKGTWSQKLGLGDFYYALAVTVLDVCRARKAFDGGLTELAIVYKHVERRRGSAADKISEDDIIRAIEKLSVLGSGLGVVKIGGRAFVRSVPAELSTDGNTIVELAQKVGGFFTRIDVATNLKWPEERIAEALLALAKDGLILVDDPQEITDKKDLKTIAAKRIYWCPAVGMEAAVEEYQRRQNLPVTGFRGMQQAMDTAESAAALEVY